VRVDIARPILGHEPLVRIARAAIELRRCVGRTERLVRVLQPDQVALTDAVVEDTDEAGFEFDVPVRFDSDRITTSLAGFAAGEVPSIPVVEVRV
jgi:uncharacterized protein (TIGR02217 family)